MTPALLALALRAETGDGGNFGIEVDLANLLGLAPGEIIPNFTTSLDAVEALIRERLPGWRVLHLGQLTSRRGGKSNWDCELDECWNGDGYVEAEGPTAARALLAATLRALASQSPDTETADGR